MDYYQGHGRTDEPKPERYKPEQDPEALDTEFRRKFPPEPLGREMDDGARVWKVYRDEAMANDATTVDGWSKTLDILLIFAGLFSAVATAFVIESYKSLQLDSGAYTAHALYALLKETSPSSVASLPRPPPLDASPSALSRWINGLWFTSLVLALAVALLCILVKQWIGEYIARNSASARNARDWARRHQVYFQALSRWPVGQLVSVLPLMLHISLFLFIAGVAAFLWDLDLGIGIWVIILGTGLIGFYLACFLLPLWYPEAPTSTPLIHQVRQTFSALLIFCWKSLAGLLDFVLHSVVFLSPHPVLQRVQRRLSAVVTPITRAVHRHFRDPVAAHGTPITSHPSLLQQLRDLRSNVEDRIASLVGRSAQLGRPTALLSQNTTLDVDVLKWLILSVPDSDAVAVGLQALGARGLDVPWVTALRADERIASMPFEAFLVTTGASLHPLEIMRAVRAALCIRNGCVPHTIPSEPRTRRSLYLPDIMHKAVMHTRQPDAALLIAYSRDDFDYSHFVRSAPIWRATASPSLTSTIIIIFQTQSMFPMNALLLLLCVNFAHMSTADYLIVLNYFRNCPEEKDPQIEPLLSERLHIFAIGELFCHVTRFLPLSQATGHAAGCLLSHIFQSPSFHKDVKVFSMRWVLIYLASWAFPLWEYDLRDYDANFIPDAADFLAGAIHYDVNPHRAELLQSFTHVLYVCDGMGARAPSEHMVTIVRHSYAFLSGLIWRPPPHRDYMIQSAVGRSRDMNALRAEPHYRHIDISPDDFESRMQMFQILDVLLRHPGVYFHWNLLKFLFRMGDDASRWWLVDHIAAVFCSLARHDRDVWLRPPRGHHLPKFLKVIPLLNVVASFHEASELVSPVIVADYENESRKALVARDARLRAQLAVRVASHCVELSPQWWQDGIDDIVSRGVSEDMCDRVLRFGIAVELAGRCNQCPGDALEWENSAGMFNCMTDDQRRNH